MISVIVATYNGRNVLPLTLKALTALTLPLQGIEFIIVDNASTDATSSVIKKFEELLPMTNVKEDKKGKAFAIRAGIAAIGSMLITVLVSMFLALYQVTRHFGIQGHE